MEDVLSFIGAVVLLALVVFGVIGIGIASLKVAEIIGMEGIWKWAFVIGIVIWFIKD